MNPQFDPKTIETLKAARNQVVQADKSGNEDKNTARGQSLNPTPAPHYPAKAEDTGQVQFTVRDKPASIETHSKELNGQQLSKNVADKFLTGFAEEFVQKLASIEQETAAVDEEIAKLEKIWLNLTEKKKQLEDRRDELIKVRDKLKELDKEMSDVLKSQSFDKLRIDPEQRRMGQ